MRWAVLLGLLACARSAPVPTRAAAPSPPEEPRGEAELAPIEVPGRTAEALLERAGVATFLEDRGLAAAEVDDDAMERWFRRPPPAVFLFTEHPVEVFEPGETVRGSCQRVRRWDSGILNELAVVVWQEGAVRTVLRFGQSTVSVADQQRDRGRWETRGSRALPVGLIGWDDERALYAEGASLHEVACAPAVRTVSCGEGLLGPKGHCLDRELVVRPWRAPFVPHVGSVIPAYDDAPPPVPEGECELRCAPSACEEALRRTTFPRVPLYDQRAAVVAAFRDAAACRAHAAEREPDAADDEVAW